MEPISLRELSLAKFRNFDHAQMKPGARFNILNGRNGMGKTNLLEAIYLMGALRSFRTTRRAELVMEGALESRLRGVFEGAAKGMVCEFDLSQKSRRLRVDGKAVSKVASHFQRLPMVLFHPATMAIVQGGPDKRRRFMDRALYQASVTYPAMHKDYGRALSNRNKVLREKPVAEGALGSFGPVLAKLGVRITRERTALLEKIAPHFETAFRDISGGLHAEASYLPKFAGDEAEFGEALLCRQPVDMARGFTTIGPHSDDLDVKIEGRAARTYGSQGQQRMVALALKIAETNVLAAETGRMPILLLDDVSSELDRQKNRQLFDFLEGAGGQVFITTTHLDYILTDRDRADFEVRDGTVSRV